MSSPLSTSGKSAADASSPESIFACADASSLAIIVPGVSICGPPKLPLGIEPALARSPLLTSPRSITSEMSAAASRMTASAPVTTHVPRSLRISIFTANLRSMCFTVSPPLPMTRPSLPLTLISTDALPVLGSIVIGGMSNDGAVWAAAAAHDLSVTLHTFTVMPPYAPGGGDNWENLFLQRSVGVIHERGDLNLLAVWGKPTICC